MCRKTYVVKGVLDARGDWSRTGIHRDLNEQLFRYTETHAGRHPARRAPFETLTIAPR